MFTSFGFLKRISMNLVHRVMPKHQFKLYRPRNINISATLQDERKAVYDQTKLDHNSLSVQLEEGHARFHYVWLRHHCLCSKCVDPKTKQRTIDLTVIPKHVKPQHVHIDSKLLEIIWEDSHRTCYDVSWLKENAYDVFLSGRQRQKECRYGSIDDESEMTLWDRDVIASEPAPEFNYCDIIANDEVALHESLNTLFRYGFVFVNETPLDNFSTLKICQKIVGPIRETPEGRVYVIENKALLNSDLSHFSNALEGHTDFSFYNDPPGVQAMHCIHHYGTGGMSLLIDGFKAAKNFFEEDPEGFEILSRTNLRFVSSHFHIQSHGTILEVDPFTKALFRVRWNTSRMGSLTKMNLRFEEMEKYYEAIRLYGSILNREENKLWFKLTPGKVVLVDNRRILHGRSAVQGPRKLIGYYVSVDDYIGKWKENRMKRHSNV